LHNTTILKKSEAMFLGDTASYYFDAACEASLRAESIKK